MVWSCIYLYLFRFPFRDHGFPLKMKNDFPGYFPEVRENILPKVTHISVRKKGGGKLQLREHEEVYFVYTDMKPSLPILSSRVLRFCNEDSTLGLRKVSENSNQARTTWTSKTKLKWVGSLWKSGTAMDLSNSWESATLIEGENENFVFIVSPSFALSHHELRLNNANLPLPIMYSGIDASVKKKTFRHCGWALLNASLGSPYSKQLFIPLQHAQGRRSSFTTNIYIFHSLIIMWTTYS